MKKLFLSMILLALPLVAGAYDAEVDGIYYNLIPKGNLAEVTHGGTGYSGSITIPEKFTYEGVEYSVTTIGNSAFSGCSGLTSVTIGNSVTSIGVYAFSNCSGLTSVTIPNSVTSIGNWAFEGCSGLTSVTIPNSVTTIGNSAFYGCTGLTSVTIPNSVTSIGVSAFYRCSSLTSVTIPNSVTSIGSSPFSGCSGLTSIIVESGNTKYDSRDNCNAIIETSTNTLISGCMNTEIPNSVTSIGRSAFYGYSGLTSVTIPNSVTSIRDYAFEGCYGLTSVTIPNSVTSIGDYAFSGCRNIEKVFSGIKMIFNINKNVFSDKTYINAMLYVPSGRIEAYKAATGWQNFVYIEEGEPESIVIPGAPKCATPTISYSNNELTFSCATEGVEYKYTIADSDVKTDYASKVSLSATYEISVYAMKEGLGNSDVATATLVWTDAIFTVTTPETPTSAKAIADSIPVLISANGGAVSVKSEQDGQPVAVYSADGKMLGAATIKDGQAAISTNLQRGEIVIVKVGGRSVKVKMSDF